MGSCVFRPHVRRPFRLWIITSSHRISRRYTVLWETVPLIGSFTPEVRYKFAIIRRGRLPGNCRPFFKSLFSSHRARSLRLTFGTFSYLHGLHSFLQLRYLVGPLCSSSPPEHSIPVHSKASTSLPPTPRLRGSVPLARCWVSTSLF